MKKRYLRQILYIGVFYMVAMMCPSRDAGAQWLSFSFYSVEKSQQTALTGGINGNQARLNQQQIDNDGPVLNAPFVIMLALASVLSLALIVIIIRYNGLIKKLKHQLDSVSQQVATSDAALEKLKESLQSSEIKRQQVMQALQKANDEINAFSYSVSHDLRAPLRAINGYSAILLEEHYPRLDDSAKRAINIIQQNSSRMDELISDLLELTRLGTLAVSKQRFNMHQLVEHVLLNKKLKSNTKLNVLPMGETFADSYLLRQVWDNLISNAIKFSSRTETPVIEIGYTRQNTEHIYWVRDNGVGFDPVYSDKLFKVFSRLHGKKEFEGTGAGLAISKKIIEAHGGRIWAEAQLAKGATFYFSLPLN